MTGVRAVSHPKIVPVILAGGSGSRLWPLSRQFQPKPFMRLADGLNFIQKTWQRAASIADVEEMVTVINRDLFFQAKDSFTEVVSDKIMGTFLLEPFGRNSAPAIALASHYVREKFGENCILLIFPADHLIENRLEFSKMMARGLYLAQEGRIVTFGIKPDSPNTGFGYIEADGEYVRNFHEKPDSATAERYILSENYFWNSGILCMTAKNLQAEMMTYCPQILGNTSESYRLSTDLKGKNYRQIEIESKSFEPIEAASIDNAILEKSDNIAIVTGDMGWSDIGSWTHFGALYPADEARNHILGNPILEDVHDCMIHAPDRVVAALGLRDLIIADTPDALLVTHKDKAQNIRHIVDRLKQDDDKTTYYFPKVERPWGSFTVIEETATFKLKRLDIKPGASLSLQSHKHRHEHWVVVGGTATVTKDEERFELEYNQSTFIPAGSKHRLKNNSDELLTLIEIQCGTYFGEDDILRYEDIYNRSN